MISTSSRTLADAEKNARGTRVKEGVEREASLVARNMVDRTADIMRMLFGVCCRKRLEELLVSKIKVLDLCGCEDGNVHNRSYIYLVVASFEIARKNKTLGLRISNVFCRTHHVQGNVTSNLPSL